MILIGKNPGSATAHRSSFYRPDALPAAQPTASKQWINCLLVAYVIAHSAVLKAVDEFVCVREITQSVKGALKCLIAVILVDVDLPYWTSKVEHLVAFTAIFSNICTAHAQKRLSMNFRCKFRRHRSIRRPRFPIRVQNFSDLATFSVDVCILYAKCPPYFYFRFADLLT